MRAISSSDLALSAASRFRGVIWAPPHADVYHTRPESARDPPRARHLPSAACSPSLSSMKSKGGPVRRRAKPEKAKSKPAGATARHSARSEAPKPLELEKRLAESLAQQAATSEILRVISSSPTDVQPVFEAIVASAVRLCDATFGGLFRFHDGQLHVAALAHLSRSETDAYHSQYPRPPHRSFIMGRAFLDGRPVHVEDVLADPNYDPAMQVGLQRVAGYRSVLAVPILRNGLPIGVVGCARREVKPFTSAQIDLVKTFAAQAVIAIENVRLFTELQQRNAALTQAP